MMARYVVVLLALAAGCDRRPQATGGPAPVPEAAAAPAPAPAPAPIAPPAPAPARPVPRPAWHDGEVVTAAVLAELAAGIAVCDLEDYDLSRQCPPRALFDRAHGTLALVTAQELDLDWAPRLIGHRTAVVRVFAASHLVPLFAASARVAGVLARAIEAERDPAAVAKMVRFATASALAADEHLRAAVVAIATTHSHPIARRGAVLALAARGVPGAVDTLVQVIDGDDDQRVRGEACRALGKLGDDAALHALARHTAEPGADPALYASCMEGLIALWADSPVYRNASQAAYELTLERLARRPPAGGRVPASPSLAPLLAALEGLGGDDAAVVAWRARARWFDAAELRRVLGAIIADDAAGFAAHAAALRTAVALGATPAELGAWRAAVPAGPLASDLDAAIAAAN